MSQYAEIKMQALTRPDLPRTGSNTIDFIPCTSLSRDAFRYNSLQCECFSAYRGRRSAAQRSIKLSSAITYIWESAVLRKGIIAAYAAGARTTTIRRWDYGIWAASTKECVTTRPSSTSVFRRPIVGRPATAQESECVPQRAWAELNFTQNS